METSSDLFNLRLKLCSLLSEMEELDVNLSIPNLFERVIELNMKIEKDKEYYKTKLNWIVHNSNSDLVIDERLNLKVDENLLSYVLMCNFMDCALVNFQSYLIDKKLDWSNINFPPEKFKSFQNLLRNIISRKDFYIILSEIGCEKLYLIDDNDTKKLEVRYNMKFDCNIEFKQKFINFLIEICELEIK